MVFVLLTQKQGEYEMIREEFEPQIHHLKARKAKGLLTPEDFKQRLEKLSEEESDRKMDVEIAFSEKEQALQDAFERLRLEKEAALATELK